LARGKRKELDFFFNVLNTSTTKREVKAYISRYKTPVSKPDSKGATKREEAVSEAVGKENHNTWRLDKSGVNLGSLYGATRAIEESPVFTYEPLPDKFHVESVEPLHVAVVKIRSPHLLDEKALGGVGLTLSQLARLGLLSVVVVDCDEAAVPEQPGELTQRWKGSVMEQCNRVAGAINEHSKDGSRVVDHILGISPIKEDVPCRVHVRGGVEVHLRDMLMKPLRAGTIPVIPPLAYTSTLELKRIQPDDAVLALTRELAGLRSPAVDEKELGKVMHTPAKASTEINEPTSLDRIIVLDPLGGLPAVDDPDKSHIFVNLEQEYGEVRERFVKEGSQPRENLASTAEGDNNSMLGASNPFTKLLETWIKPPPDALGSSDPQALQSQQPPLVNRHVKNLDLIQRCLSLLPPSSSALLTTPDEAASSAFTSVDDTEATVTGVSTRPKRNPLIHNLLTDKPIISSSLPAARIASPSSTESTNIAHSTPATFFKRGMPLTIIPDPRMSPWAPPGPDTEPLQLESDPRIDFPSLVHLIEDSFGRKLNVQDYLSRIRGRIAGVIIAGGYEGGAILTWETPPPSPGDSSPRAPVPYLDKFAVLRRSQGSGGVADVVFNAMVRDCLPDGVVWRSRRENPVNKWYFERSVGTWKIPKSQWTMFWTGADVDWGSESAQSKGGDEERKLRWKDYVGVCEGIQASWADSKPPD
jgi:amino-acid N-acetyltransferase